MNFKPLAAALAMMSVAVHAEPPAAPGPTLITVSAKAADVRTVIADLFGQAKKSFVLEPNTYFALYLSLRDVDFDEALMIICKNASLVAEQKNGIYYISKAKSKPVVESLATKIQPEKVVAPPKPKGQISAETLKKRITIRLAKADLRVVFGEISRQAGVTIEIDKDVPNYKLDAFLVGSTLRSSLADITQAAGLEFKLTDDQTIQIKLPAKPATGVRISN